MGVPAAVLNEVVRLQESEDWINTVPAWAELMTPGRPTRFKHHKALTVADAEQLTEQHTRLARAAIERFLRTGSQHSARTAARHILRGRTYRCLYIRLTGQTGTTEADMPLPLESPARDAGD